MNVMGESGCTELPRRARLHARLWKPCAGWCVSDRKNLTRAAVSTDETRQSGALHRLRSYFLSISRAARIRSASSTEVSVP